MIFQGAMNSLDPVFTIKQQFDEILKQHDCEDKSDKIIDDVICFCKFGSLCFGKISA